MEIKIYVDVLFFINLLFNYLLLWMTGILLRQHAGACRQLFSAAFGALYAVCIFFLPVAVFYALPGKLLIGMLMVLLTYRPHSLLAWLKCSCVFFATVFILGGISLSCVFFYGETALQGILYRNGALYMNLPVSLLLILFALCYGILKVAFSLGAKMNAVGKQIITLHVVLGERIVTLRGFYDSGNLLQDRHGRGVMITEKKRVVPLFESQKNLKTSLAQFHFKTLKGHGKLQGFLPDAMYREEGRRLIPVAPCYVAVTDEPLNYYHNWDTILPHNFEGVENDESRTQAII